jgi:hypothetical protein
LYGLLSTKATAGALKETVVFGGFTAFLHPLIVQNTLTVSWIEP